MLTGQDSINRFKFNMNELLSTPIILCDSKVSEVLKTITNSQLLLELFEHCIEDFDYDKFRTVCFIDGTENSYGKYISPANLSDFLALAFCLLCKFDRQEENIIKFSNSYFSNGGDTNSNYNNFCKQFLIPFAQTTIDYAQKILDNNFKTEEKQEEVKQVEEEKEVKHSTFFSIFIDKINSTKLLPEEKEEGVFLVESIRDNYENENYENLALGLIAFKYFCKNYKKAKLNYNTLFDYVNGK